MARLIAKALNCLDKKNRPCNACALCKDFNESRAMDLLEIDAASNRGIDEIRELREGVRFVPTQGKYKTYIIDEVHMLTKEAFNALLKTLEEPPAHAVFVLATTEIEKVPATIISRTQHYNFHRPQIAQIAARLQMIAKKEGATLDVDASHLIALAAEGALRDGESILGQIMAIEDKKITREEVEQILGLPKREAVKRMFSAIAQKDTSSAIILVQELTDAGHDLNYVAKLLMRYFRAALLLKTDSTLASFVDSEFLPDERECISTHLPMFSRESLARGVTAIFDNMQKFKKSPIPQLSLEVTIVELTADRELNNSEIKII
jgi:DNA polymerase-3 subunit gamma/tau